MNTNVYKASILTLLIFMSLSCQKGFLDTKPNTSLSIVSTLEDCELLLNNERLFNYFSGPGLGTLSSDEFFVMSDVWSSIGDPKAQNAYIFAKRIYPVGSSVSDWDNPYKQVYTSNLVLESIDEIKISNSQQEQYNSIKGTALFYRSWAFFNLLQTFAAPFDSASAGQIPGIPLRLTSDFNIKIGRNSLLECYQQILRDVESSISLLPVNVSYVTKPNKAAANAFLARIYLIMGDYQKALEYAGASLDTYSQLMDYNLIDTNSPFYFSTDKEQYPLKEVLYHNTMIAYSLASYTSMIVDSTLYSLYEINDLRKTAFFATYNGYIRFKGSYEFVRFGTYFDGLATDEVLLTKAECNARLGNISNAMEDLNTLLSMRYKAGTFIPLSAMSSEDALRKVLLERRKELCFRGSRWTDLRRLNKDPSFALTISRNIENVSYTLSPNDPRYTFPIPDPEIELSGIEQNPR